MRIIEKKPAISDVLRYPDVSFNRVWFLSRNLYPLYSPPWIHCVMQVVYVYCPVYIHRYTEPTPASGSTLRCDRVYI